MSIAEHIESEQLRQDAAEQAKVAKKEYQRKLMAILADQLVPGAGEFNDMQYKLTKTPHLFFPGRFTGNPLKDARLVAQVHFTGLRLFFIRQNTSIPGNYRDIGKEVGEPKAGKNYTEEQVEQIAMLLENCHGRDFSRSSSYESYLLISIVGPGGPGGCMGHDLGGGYAYAVGMKGSSRTYTYDPAEALAIAMKRLAEFVTR